MGVCLSLFAGAPALLWQRAGPLAEQVAWIELRLDTAPETDFAALAAAAPRPVIAACPQVAEGGRFRGGRAARDARLVAAARGGARFVDVPLGAPLPEGLPADTRVVHSWHERRGEGAELRERLHRIEARLAPGDVAKIVAWAEDHDEASRVLALYGTTRAPLVAFAQGPGGRATRAWAPVLGAPWTYACLPGEATAAGQWSVPELLALHPPGGAGASTGLFGVVGRPVARSRSPLLWNTAFRMAGLDAFYLPLELQDFGVLTRTHRAEAFQGFSVTAPFKRAALEAADEAEPAAREAGTANTLMRTARGWRAADTDGPAVLEVLEAAGAEPPGPLLVLGAGGAARAAVAAARRQGWRIHVAARRASAAGALAEDLAGIPGAQPVTAGALDAADPAAFAAVLQATPVGSAHLPGNLLANRCFAPGTVVLDAVYDPADTALLAQARREGAIPVPGRRMLLAQMLRQFRLLTGTTLPPEPLARALETALEAGR